MTTWARDFKFAREIINSSKGGGLNSKYFSMHYMHGFLLDRHILLDLHVHSN